MVALAMNRSMRLSNKTTGMEDIARSRRGAALVCLIALRVDTFPSRSIRIVVPFPPGGPVDIIARIIGQKMTEDWG
jgi:tripartite-type tricarboxylate transporter receptor subunit TctC